MSKINPTQAAALKAPVEKTSPAAKPATKPAITKAAGTAKPAAKSAAKPAPATAIKAAVTKIPVKKAEKVKAEKEKAPKLKMERDSFTMPKTEYAQFSVLKNRLDKLGQPAKKSELIRAGLMQLSAMTDAALKAALSKVPAIKTGRPKKK